MPTNTSPKRQGNKEISSTTKATFSSVKVEGARVSKKSKSTNNKSPINSKVKMEAVKIEIPAHDFIVISDDDEEPTKGTKVENHVQPEDISNVEVFDNQNAELVPEPVGSFLDAARDYYIQTEAWNDPVCGFHSANPFPSFHQSYSLVQRMKTSPSLIQHHESNFTLVDMKLDF
ncbi:hypothetical protein WICPIJ_002977 [Wickerhamomyces pijperi]|uniref:Uncharacterized protein n=1 Tax=Wickerhamomyces pijperi TaxID=599730 RepID=A0A9P8TNF5_WICPI|nr:hypothetical protein WICPIJ_002977 [Wickerhamomyces pijperi]